MSTRSWICETLPDRKVRAITCHHDGYPTGSGVGAMLKKHWTRQQDIDELFALGDLRDLGPDIIYDPAKEAAGEKITHAYSTDYPEDADDNEAIVFDSFESAFAAFRMSANAFIYLWKDGTWRGWNWLESEITTHMGLPREGVLQDGPS